MKKRFIFCGLVLAAFVFAACGKGGSIEVTNKGNSHASIFIQKGTSQLGDSKGAEPGDTVTFSIDEDGIYTVGAVYTQPTPGTLVSKYISVSGGDTVRVTVNN